MFVEVVASNVLDPRAARQVYNAPVPQEPRTGGGGRIACTKRAVEWPHRASRPPREPCGPGESCPDASRPARPVSGHSAGRTMTTRPPGVARDGSEAASSDAAGPGATPALPVTVTYLEMTSKDQRVPGPGWSEPTLVQRAERPTISFYRYLYDTVGADWDWRVRRRLSDDELAAIIHDDAVEVWVPYVRGYRPASRSSIDVSTARSRSPTSAWSPSTSAAGSDRPFSTGRSSMPGAATLAGSGFIPARWTTRGRWPSTAAPDSRCTTAR